MKILQIDLDVNAGSSPALSTKTNIKNVLYQEEEIRQAEETTDKPSNFGKEAG